ncbi:MAG: GNAT family N-acetyltransferase [Planctomycetota bacterium]
MTPEHNRGASTPLALTFRDRVQPGDAEGVRSLVAATGYFTDAEVDVAMELVVERLKLGAASGYYFVFAETRGKLAGYACYGPIACTVASFDLYWIAVDPTLQRGGVGSAILREVEQRVRAAGGGAIYIDTSNKPQYASTRGFYLRSGYEQVALLKDFYAPHDDKVIYAKQGIR